MSRQVAADTFRDRWLHAAMRRPEVVDRCCAQVVIAALYAQMLDDGTVSMKRADLADAVAKSERQVQERLRELVKLGLLVRQRRGQKHLGAAIYQAAIPVLSEQPQEVPAEVDPQGASGPHPEDPLSEQPQGVPTLDKGKPAAVPTPSESQDATRAGDDEDPFASLRSSAATVPTGQPGTQPGGMRGPVQTQPQGAEDHDEWCRGCGGWLRVAGTVVDGRCSRCAGVVA